MDKRIDQITGHAGEWFVYLKPGYAMDGAHCFGEDNKAAIRRTMTTVKPCECAECQSLKAS